VSSDPKRPLIGGFIPRPRRGALAPETPPVPQTLVDSLQVLTGGGVNIKERPGLLGLMHRILPGRKDRGGLLGIAFKYPDGLIGVQDINDRDTVAHEFGHIADFRNKHPGVADAIKRLTPEGEPDKEHFADVYMSAISFLQGQASRRPDVAARVLDNIDLNLPGSRMLVQELLRDPLYAQHPLNQAGK
jgi:hypothetical protein